MALCQKRQSWFRCLLIVAMMIAVRAPVAFAGRGWQMGSNEAYVAQTDDGWVLPIWRYTPRVEIRGRSYPPVVLCHGMGANRFNLAQTGPGNLATWLASRGRDVFVIELRGAGRSVDLTPDARSGGKWNYDFDSYRDKDIPAILARIQQVTGSAEVDWVGHSMGGMLLYSIAGHDLGFSGNVRIRRGVAIASPGMIQDLPIRLNMMLHLAEWFPWEQLPNRWWLRTIIQLYPHFVPENEPSLGFKGNYDPSFIPDFVANVGSDLSRSLVRQVRSWYGRGGIFSRDGSVNYTDEMKKSTVPIRFIAANRDHIGSIKSVQRAFEAQGPEKDMFVLGKDSAGNRDYGHTDIVAGKYAPVDTFPLVESWLSGKAPLTASRD